ncbi:MAG: Glu-tRNA(Gln) amidotransferase subunit GatE [Candidatus Hatepunaea meridiana]|nr:Glu-tRNA(Gln) amidotransferase subunit GatE [Candidatus Hatepunaea meridiana]
MKTNQSIHDFNPRAAGFRCGLEIHQQLYTEKKLFCRCPAGLYSNDYDAQVLRHMRPTLSELGEYDGTALMEFKTKKEIIYRLNKKSVCTYEMDDTPPFPINQKAVDIAIEIALLLNCAIVGELHVSRKQYLDGSIPAGFQRTAIVGVNGWIPYKDRKINIIQLAIEEDACREVSDVGHLRVYATDRLAMPLIEVVTAPDMLDPQESYEVGVQLGRLLRATSKVRRGIGSVRQDVNVSVTGGTRVEIKGVPRLPLIPDLVHWEACRQYSLLGMREEMKERGIKQDNLESERFDITGQLSHPAIARLSDDSFKVSAILLKGLSGLLVHKIGFDRTFADDVAGRVRVIACLQHRPVMLHSDDTSVSGFSQRDLELLSSITGRGKDDLVVVVWGPMIDVETALNEIEIRFKEAADGIPNETRQVLSTGETDFERILPGPNRMYPDTDSPPIVISSDRVAAIRKKLPELPWDREKRYKEMGIPHHLSWMLAISPRAILFDKLTSNNGVAPKLTAVVLIELIKHFNRLGGNPDSISDSDLEALFLLYQKGAFSREGFRLLIEGRAHEKDADWMRIADKIGIRKVDNKEIKDAIERMVVSLNDNGTVDDDLKNKVAMGLVMKDFRGCVPGVDLAQMVSEFFSGSDTPV